ncbi:hypothetical protein ACTFRN_09375 [Bacillus cereus group sp. MYBK245-2]|uniref:hypothetical protein n=1 Tax=Bacillus cereus group TaxID=86661 RepID=UPI0020C946AA|nr:MULTISPECIES: hypothetical protein [Bacillus cereus group]MDA1507887.1 hypothetical protein [Bacillus cereus group sp. TH36-2LC]MDA1576304.1 hypothetical protein [Bacillus cereus group sp. TH242-3LC]MDA1828962.1 hypothetical protein [Bacillus cereus group sp. BY25LC]MDA1895074.1 hypothetical protein [Bacillus cereus group sp. BcHK28]MDA1942909.1 hypothetical protein [Bacillus cereus group sp. BcHK124]
MEFLKDTEAIGYIVMGVSRMGYGLDVIFQAMDVAQLVLNQTLKEELWNEDVLEVVGNLVHEIEINEDELKSEMYWSFDIHTENEAGIIYKKIMDLRKNESKLTR